MTTNQFTSNRISSVFSLIRQSLNGEQQVYTTGSIRRAVILLAIPMMLEMCMESVFAVVDIYFVKPLRQACHIYRRPHGIGYYHCLLAGHWH